MIDVQDWKNHKRINFRNEDIPSIFFPDFKYEVGLSLKTEIHFDNCNIESIGASTLYLGGRITLNNCTVKSGLGFYATYFWAGFEMRKCTLKGDVTFSCGVHNLFPNTFIIDSCMFEDYVDFFDIYFEGSTTITNNKFLKGTNLALYAKSVKEGAELKVENNEGDLRLRTADDPFYSIQRK